MENEEIKNYILRYKNDFSREEIEKGLTESGVPKSKINHAYREMSVLSPDVFSNEVPHPGKMKSEYVIGGLGVFFFMINPFLGIIASLILIPLFFIFRKKEGPIWTKIGMVILVVIFLGFALPVFLFIIALAFCIVAAAGGAF